MTTSGDKVAQPEPRLREVAGFRLFATARVVAWLGHALSLVALPILAYQRTGSATLTGLLAAAESLPYLILGLVIGAYVDRHDGRRILAVATAFSGVASLTVPAAAAAGLLTVAQPLVVAFVVGVAFVFGDAAYFGVLPRLVGRERVGAATASLSAAYTVIGIGMPGLAGVLVPFIGAPAVIGVDGALTVTAAAMLTAVPRRAPEPGSDSESGEPRRLWRDVGEGLAYIWRHPVVRPLTLLGFGNSFTGGAVAGLVVVMAVERLGLPDDDGRIGLLYAASALGAFVGSLLLGRLQRRLPVGRLTLTGFTATTLLVVAWGTTTNWVLGLATLFALDLVDSIVVLNGIVVRQSITPMRLQGRVNTTARVIAWGGAPLGAAVGGAIAGAWRIDAALYICAAAVGLALVAGLLSGVARLGMLADLIREAHGPDRSD